MSRSSTEIHEIHKRFVRGLLLGMRPGQLHAFVTGRPEDEREEGWA